MKTIGSTLICLSLLFSISCDKEEEKVINELNLINCWTHSLEEDNIRSQYIYRPCDYTEFPSRKYRQEYTFKEDGACTYSVLSPTDNHYTDTGTWDFDDSKSLISIKKEGELVLELEVVETGDAILKLWQ